ncbi:MAG: NAD-dependent epimerase/dehydratase family protein [Dehalococcoidia bacterium]|nr:NAD-dependent epimerase/dehydratase family protein [Dehalococcoidia bacterium]
MTKLVTGGMGFVGAQLGRDLVEQGEDVVLFDLVPNYYRIEGIENKVKVVQGDLRSWHDIFNVVRQNNIEGIYHVGAMLSMVSEANPWASFEANLLGTYYILEAARLFDVKRVVFASTSDTFGLGIKENTITDETIQRPINIYGITKLTGELLGRYYRSKFGVDFRSVRFGGAAVGPGVKTNATSQYNAWMIEAAALGKSYECYVTEDTMLPVMYFKDYSRALGICYDAPSERIKTVNYNISGLRPSLTAKQLELAIKKHVPDFQVTYKPDPQVMDILSQQFQVEVDDSRAEEELGWKTSYSDLDKIIEDFIKEVRVHPKRYGLS